MATKWLILFGICTAAWIANDTPALAIDLNGPWATDASVCNKAFIKKGNAISFVGDSDQFGGGKHRAFV